MTDLNKIRMKNKIKIQWLMVLVLLGLFGSNMLYGQEKKLVKIKGQVINENSLPLSGIQVKSFIGKDLSVTDKDGNFELEVAVNQTDHLSLNEAGYEFTVVPVSTPIDFKEPVVLKKNKLIEKQTSVLLPFKTLENQRNVASVFTVSGEQLRAFPTASFLDALAGLLPGVSVTTYNSMPGYESGATQIAVRRETATVYIDGVIRDPYDLSPEEVEKVQVIRDFSGRAALGVYGSGPVIWITTRKGQSFNREVSFSAEYGMSTPTILPEYLGAYEYATLQNEALVNDGLSAYYSNEALNAYRDNTDPLNYPNLDYVAKYVSPSAPFRRANINFSGGDEKVNYFSMVSYVGSEGLEAVGERYKSDRFKLRGNVNINLNEFIRMNVNLSGTYRSGRGPVNNLFEIISALPSNAHAISYNDKLIVSNDFPVNIENEMLHKGFQQTSALGTQNNVNLFFDLNDYVEGLSASGSVSFDASSQLINGKSLSAELYRLVKAQSGADSTELVQTEVVQDDLSLFGSTIQRKTVTSFTLNYDRVFGKHALATNASYYQGIFERNSTSNYQPDKMQDITLRGNYSYDEKYIAQFDLVFSGSMHMPKGKRFSAYPTLGLGWNISNESFMKDSKTIDYLKLTGSFGIMGTNNFSLYGYNSYYMYETLWEQGGYWRTGALGTFAEATIPFTILQQGSDNYSVPKKQILNIGLQGALLDHSLSFEVNYYRNRDFDLISTLSSATPSIFGSGQFLPVGNYGENVTYGLDGMVNYSKKWGDFSVNLGLNALYARGRYVVVDELAGLEEYRKVAGKDMDAYLMYQAEGLFKDNSEIAAATAKQIWGEVKPGDIRYTDYNNDQVIDEKDRFVSEYHTPRIYYGLNLTLAYKGISLYIAGQGNADGMDNILNEYMVSYSPKQNYSKQMLNRWPVTNQVPRLTTTSRNNTQYSTFWLVDGSSFRVKNVELAYTLPKSVSKHLTANECRFFVRGTNLFTVSEVTRLGMEIENKSAGINSYPLYSTLTFGVSCKF